MTDAERDELKTLIRETIREMAKETAEIIFNTPVAKPTRFGTVYKLESTSNERLDSR